MLIASQVFPKKTDVVFNLEELASACLEMRENNNNNNDNDNGSDRQCLVGDKYPLVN